MATSSTSEAEPKPKKIVTIHRFQIGVNVIVQSLVVLGIVLMINYLSFRHFKRWDFSRDQKYALSSQTVNVLKNLQKPVKAIIFFSSAAEIAPDVNNLLREYEYASNGKFKTEIVDPFRSLTRAQELQAKYKFGANENILILDVDGKSKFVNAQDMADVEMPDQMAMMMGQAQPHIKDFKGEQAITSALIELTEGKANKVYYVVGDGEPDLQSKDLGDFSESLKRQNIQVSPLTLLNVSAIPDDARAIIINGPKSDLSDVPMKLLGDFWEKKGRIFILLNPFAKTPHLTDWLEPPQGIVPQEDRIIRTGKFLQMDQNGSPQLTTGVISNPAFVVLNSHTSITKDLEGREQATARAHAIAQGRQSSRDHCQAKHRPDPPVGEGFWGATDYSGGEGKQVFFDPKRDHMGPLNIAIAVEKGGVEDQRVKMDSSRLVVVGNAEFLGNNAYRTLRRRHRRYHGQRSQLAARSRGDRRHPSEGKEDAHHQPGRKTTPANRHRGHGSHPRDCRPVRSPGLVAAPRLVLLFAPFCHETEKHAHSPRHRGGRDLTRSSTSSKASNPRPRRPPSRPDGLSISTAIKSPGSRSRIPTRRSSWIRRTGSG